MYDSETLVICWSIPVSMTCLILSRQFQTFIADGGKEIHGTLALSGEPPVHQLAISYGSQPGNLPVSTVAAHWALQQRKVEYQSKYLEYWRSTALRVASGRIVDAVIMPVAPSASVKPGEGAYFGYTGVANVLDFTSIVVPISKVDKTVDVTTKEQQQYQPISDMDRQIWESCKHHWSMRTSLTDGSQRCR